MGTSKILKSLFDQTRKLPVDDKVMLIKIIEKWLIADNLRSLANEHFDIPSDNNMDEIEEMVFDEIVEEEKEIERLSSDRC